MLRLGSFSSSSARAQTRSAWVESSPPETPMTSFLVPVACMRVTRPCTWMRYTSSQRRSRSEEHTSELQSHLNIVCRLLLEKKNKALAHSDRQENNKNKLSHINLQINK